MYTDRGEQCKQVNIKLLSSFLVMFKTEESYINT